ncbi:unnamed protein product [Urochloa decumbens]|uniref:Phospho-2-dehydro-3-deoxyheptonate aldolase n=1 Tax=Urochloa decumbens TaxID=240449 RepID=A0ABC8YFN1_9POAL
MAPSAVPHQAPPTERTTPAKWTVDSWRTKTALQQPKYPDAAEAEAVLRAIESFPPLVLPGEARSLEERLAAAAAGRAFLLQGGDCAESFKEFSDDTVRATFRVLLQMSAVLTATGRLLKYRGDLINGHAFDEKSRAPDPQRMVRAYAQSAATVNLLRALAATAECERVAQWEDMGFAEHDDRYLELARWVDEALGFMAAAAAGQQQRSPTEFWSSHECLLLPYEEALTRRDDASGLFYDSSAHMLWVGERTRQLDGAHVEFLRGVSNPLGIKVSDQMDPAELVKLIEILNPSNRPGRITIITRMGADKLRAKLPHLIRAVRDAGQIVTWVSDPMHGNSTVAPCGLRTRHFASILDEVHAFFDVHEQEGSHPGGVHLEMTGQHVTECVGGSCNVSLDDLNTRYYTHCDPRLNASQSLELSFIISARLRKSKRINY